MSTPEKDPPTTMPMSQILVQSPAISSPISTDIVLNCGSFLLPHDLWIERIQDLGRPFCELGSKTYKRNKIMSVGPPSHSLYYYDLTAIAVDLCKIMRSMQELDEGWMKLPKNPTQIKEKIVSTIMALRSQQDDGRYYLSQDRFLNNMQNVWGATAVDVTPHANDRVRLFGIIMTEPRMRPYLERLCDGITSLEQLDSPSLSIPQIFADIRLAFNNEEVVVTFPDLANDLENIDLLDPNDPSRISIDRDRKNILFLSQYFIFSIS